jgi:Putative Flp pilus-assembly TadE/G-like
MRRLIVKRARNVEQGVTAVILAVCSTVLLGVAALVIDVGAARVERRELQNGADAAALALAHDCALGSCGNLNATAGNYANLNSLDAASRATASLVGANSVRVVARTSDVGVNSDGDGNTIDFNWAPILGGPSGGEVTANATASWGVAGGASTLPLTFSRCEWDALAGPGVFPTPPGIIYFHTSSGPPSLDAPCPNRPAGMDSYGNITLDGGFGWLEETACRTTVLLGWVSAKSGNGHPSCLNNAIGKDFQLPIFDAVAKVGNPGWRPAGCIGSKCYRIYGIATFHVTGYRFPGQTANPPCGPPQSCLGGYFIKFTLGSDGGPFVPGPNDLGTYVVRLTE